MKKTKRSLLIGIAAMGLVAASAGAVSTFAWYQASNASVSNTAAAGTISTSQSTFDLDALSITFTIGATDVQLSDYASSKLQYGVYYSAGNGKVADVTAGNVASFVDTVSVTAAWATNPTGDTLTSIKGKTITGATLTTAGYAKLRSSATDLTGADVVSQALTVTVSADGLSLTVAATSGTNVFVRVQAKYGVADAFANKDLDSDHASDALSIAAGSLTVA